MPAPAGSAPTVSNATSTAAAATDADVLGRYRASLAAHLHAYQRYPVASRMRREEGLVVLDVTIQRDGQIVTMGVQHGSGWPALDDAALATVKRAEPLPAMPDALPGARMALVVPLRFRLE